MDEWWMDVSSGVPVNVQLVDCAGEWVDVNGQVLGDKQMNGGLVGESMGRWPDEHMDGHAGGWVGEQASRWMNE